MISVMVSLLELLLIALSAQLFSENDDFFASFTHTHLSEQQLKKICFVHMYKQKRTNRVFHLFIFIDR
jgi:hypothetical protein